jgi:hypothetical protein
LLILRAATGWAPFSGFLGGTDIWGAPILPLSPAAIAMAALVWIGLWTPAAGVAEAALQVCLITLNKEPMGTGLVFASLGLALACLGPGSWSVDARLFGRKRLL